MQFPAHRIGGQVELCLVRGYAFSEVCLKGGLTVVLPNYYNFLVIFRILIPGMEFKSIYILS
jgi:hypothetical protein